MKRCKGLFIGLILIIIFTCFSGCTPTESGVFTTYIEPNKVTVSNVTYETQENIVIYVYVEDKKSVIKRIDEIDSFENIEINLIDHLPKEDFENKNISVEINKSISRDYIAVMMIFSAIGSVAIIVFIILLLMAKKEYKVNKDNWG